MPTTLLRRAAAAAAVTVVAAAPAAAQTYTGTTIGGPTFNRPLAGNPPSGLSAVGTATAYSVQPFFVAASGSYSFLSTATTPANWDNFLLLYRTQFLPGAALTNVIIGNDDFPTIGLAGFNNVSLTAGVQYFLVTTGFGNTSAGAFSNTITGPQSVTFGIIPEPSTWVLLGVGLAGVGAAARRRRANA